MQVARATARSADPKDHATEIEPTEHAFAVRVHSSEKKIESLYKYFGNCVTRSFS